MSLFAALNFTTGEVLGEWRPNRNGANFLAFLTKAVKPHAGMESMSSWTTVHVHHAGREDSAGEKSARELSLHPRRALVAEQVEIWFGIITRQPIRRGTFASVNVLVKQIHD